MYDLDFLTSNLKSVKHCITYSEETKKTKLFYESFIKNILIKYNTSIIYTPYTLTYEEGLYFKEGTQLSNDLVKERKKALKTQLTIKMYPLKTIKYLKNYNRNFSSLEEKQPLIPFYQRRHFVDVLDFLIEVTFKQANLANSYCFYLDRHTLQIETVSKEYIDKKTLERINGQKINILNTKRTLPYIDSVLIC